MEVYYCGPCKYFTCKLSNFKRHMGAKTHSELSNDTIDENTNMKIYKRKIHCCNNCDKFYTTKKSLQNHELQCLPIQSVEILKDKIKTLEKQLDLKDNQLNKALDVAKENSQATNTSMNMLKYANMYLGNVKPLEELKGDDIFDVIKYDNPKGTENKNEKYVRTVIHKFSNGVFANFVGDMIIEHYKPKSQNDANFISTDTSRLCFIMMQKVKNKDKIEKKEWINDKSGKKFTELVLNPLMLTIKEILTDYIDFKKHKELDEYLLCQMGKCVELKRDIDVDKFIKPILKYVAPSFHFDKLKFLDEDVSDDEFLPQKTTKIKIRVKKCL